jgi:two-component system, NtrC family, sensor histidine kinase GlrK
MSTTKQVHAAAPLNGPWPAHLAHQLKTPLATVRDSAELLADGTLGPLTAAQQEVADILRRNSRELQRLIVELLGEEKRS